MSLGHQYQSFWRKTSKTRSFFRKITLFMYWLNTWHTIMVQLWSIPHSIAPYLPKKMRVRWTKLNEKWRQETRSKIWHNKKTPCIITKCIIFSIKRITPLILDWGLSISFEFLAAWQYNTAFLFILWPYHQLHIVF